MPVEVLTQADLSPVVDRVTALENAPPVPPVDLQPLRDVDALLSGRLASLASAVVSQGDKIAALESKPPVDLSPLQATLAALEVRVKALEPAVPTPTPTPLPPPSPPPPPPPPPVPVATDLNLNLLGGWRIERDYARGGFALEYSGDVPVRLYMVGHAQRNEINVFDLPPPGTGSDINLWPRVKPTRIIPLFWTGGYGNGAAHWRGKLWITPRYYYDKSDPLVATTTWFAEDGEKIVIALPRQQYGGFVKSVHGIEPGCGGYESGDGSAFGPTLGTMDGQKLIAHGFESAWDKRERREPNYWPINHKDDWFALEPRTINGTLEGRWGIDRIYSGGIRTASGIYYWPYMGTGQLDYKLQSTTFGVNGTNKTYLYHYDPTTYQLIGWKETDFKGPIQGQEISPDGKKVYLMEGQAWKVGIAAESPVLRLYEVK